MVIKVLGSDWKDIPAETLIERQQAFGAPDREVTTEGYFAVWGADSTYRQVSCSDSRDNAEGCRITGGYGTLEQLEKEIEVLRDDGG